MDQYVKVPKPPWKPKFSNVAYWTIDIMPPGNMGIPGDIWGCAEPGDELEAMYVRNSNSWVAVPENNLVKFETKHPLGDHLLLCFEAPDRVVWMSQSTSAHVRRRYTTTKPIQGGIVDYSKVTCQELTKLRYRLAAEICASITPPLSPYPTVNAARQDGKGPSVRKRPDGFYIERARKRAKLSEESDDEPPSASRGPTHTTQTPQLQIDNSNASLIVSGDVYLDT